MAATAQEKEQLLRQIEYYFCDLSFPFDDFLKGQADEAGSVPVATLAGSPRIVSMTPGLSTEERVSLLCEVLPDSDSVLLVGGDRLKRKYPCPEDDELAPRSAYIAGLPKSSDEEELKALLLGSSKADKFAPVLSIRRQRDLKKDRSFTGQVFVELEDEAKARALVACCNNGTVPCSKAKILKDFFASQAASIEAVKVKRAARDASGEPSGGAKRPRDEDGGASAIVCEPENRGLVVRFEGAGESADREAIEAIAKGYGEVAYINYSRGESTGHVRFKSAEVASAAIAGLNATPADIGGATPTWCTLTSAEEDAYWQEYHAALKQRKKHKGGKGKGKGKGKGGGKGKGKGKGGGD